MQETHEGHSDALSFGFAGMQGWRVSMVRGQWAGRVPGHASAAHDGRNTHFSLSVAQEDAHILSLNFDSKPRTALFSVFDGHGGKAVALYAAKHLVRGMEGLDEWMDLSCTSVRVVGDAMGGHLRGGGWPCGAAARRACNRARLERPVCIGLAPST